MSAKEVKNDVYNTYRAKYISTITISPGIDEKIIVPVLIRRTTHNYEGEENQLIPDYMGFASLRHQLRINCVAYNKCKNDWKGQLYNGLVSYE